MSVRSYHSSEKWLWYKIQRFSKMFGSRSMRSTCIDLSLFNTDYIYMSFDEYINKSKIIDRKEGLEVSLGVGLVVTN